MNPKQVAADIKTGQRCWLCLAYIVWPDGAPGKETLCPRCESEKPCREYKAIWDGREG